MKKKILLTSLLGLTIVCPAMAEPNIAADAESASCTNSVLQTYTGPTQLEAEYTANTINLKWYDADGEITSVQNASKTCTYDGSITLPTTNPTRTGYTFAGWQVRAAAAPSNPQQSGFDLSTWNYGTVPSWDADYVAWNPLNGNNGFTVWWALEYGGLEGDTDRSASLSNGEWAVTFGNGTVKGVATCSTEHPTNGYWYDTGIFTSDHFSTTLTAGDYNDTDKEYCWCKATSVDTGSGYQSVASARWVFSDDLGDADGCASNCAFRCAQLMYYHDDFRGVLFGVAGD